MRELPLEPSRRRSALAYNFRDLATVVSAVIDAPSVVLGPRKQLLKHLVFVMTDMFALPGRYTLSHLLSHPVLRPECQVLHFITAVLDLSQDDGSDEGHNIRNRLTHAVNNAGDLVDWIARLPGSTN
jgi:hypothetical protein